MMPKTTNIARLMLQTLFESSIIRPESSSKFMGLRHGGSTESEEPPAQKNVWRAPFASGFDVMA
jgi:hypothetical protein